jgi:hypothetical protein
MKQITLTYKYWDKPEVINNAQELYDLYNGFAIDMELIKNLNGKEDKDYETVNQIRENYEEVFEKVKAGTYSLEKFEKKALEVIG